MRDETPSDLELLKLWRAGDEDAADELFRRYVGRLVGLVRQRLSPRLARRIDAEDVVQSVYRSFFTDARTDRYQINEEGDLWRLLVGMAIKKLHRSVEFHTAAKRSIAREDSARSPRDARPFDVEALAQTPEPSEAAAIGEELNRLLDMLESPQREIVELKLQGSDVAEIAREVDRSQRTVRRVLEQFRTNLELRLR